MAPWEEEASGAEKVPKGGRLIAHGPPRCCGRRAARRGPARAAGIAALQELGPESGPRLTALAWGQRARTAEIAAARAVLGGRFAAGPAGPGMPHCRRRKREGRGRELRSAAGRGGPAGLDLAGPASPGRGRWAGPGLGSGTGSGVPG